MRTVLRRWPAHLRGNPHLRKKLRREANFLRAFYGMPVYLVGSALIDSNADPRDWDIRIVLDDPQFRRRYGDPDDWYHQGQTGAWTRVRWRWSDDCVKQSKRSSAVLGVNVDLQIHPRVMAEAFKYQHRFRLDTRGVR